MSLPSVDEMLKMTSEELDALRESELQKLFSSIEDEERRKKMERFQWVIKSKIQTGKHNYITLNTAMMQLFYELNEKLQEFKQ